MLDRNHLTVIRIFAESIEFGEPFGQGCSGVVAWRAGEMSVGGGLLLSFGLSQQQPVEVEEEVQKEKRGRKRSVLR